LIGGGGVISNRLLFVELISFPVGHHRKSDADQHGWKDQYEDAAAQCLGDSSTGTGGLRVTKGAILGRRETWKNEAAERCHGKRGQSAGHRANSTLGM
jgi:hypothetical protein